MKNIAKSSSFIPYLFVCQNVSAKLDFAKGTFTDGLAEDILANFALIYPKLDIGSLFVCLDANLV